MTSANNNSNDFSKLPAASTELPRTCWRVKYPNGVGYIKDWDLEPEVEAASIGLAGWKFETVKLEKIFEKEDGGFFWG